MAARSTSNDVYVRSRSMASSVNASEPDRVALQWLYVAGLLAGAPLAMELPPWVSVIFVAAVLWRYAIERFHAYRPGRVARYTLLALVLLVAWREFGTVLGREPGLALLISLLGLKLLELRSVRDAMFTLFLTYVVLAGGFLFAQTLVIGLWAIGATVVSLAALVRLQQVMPAREALHTAALLALKAVPIMIILYVLFPRLGGTLWGLPSDAHAGLTGMPEEIQLGTINNLIRSEEVAFRVDFEDTVPAGRELYWRGPVLWYSDGKRWRYRSTVAGADPLLPQGAPVKYRVTLEPNNKYWLFALDLPAAAPAGAFQRPDFTLVRQQPVRERIGYALTSYTRYTTGETNATARRAALLRPPMSQRLRTFAQTLRAQHSQPAAVVQAVLNHFRTENFVYTLQPPLLGDDPVDEFLFETRRGFCEHYAVAFTTLMRAAGIPARIVLGYQGGELNPSGDYLIVRQSDAHAWSEVWLDGRGWTRVDPTAAIAPERVELGLDAVRRLEAQGLRAGNLDPNTLARALDLPWVQRALHRARLYWDYTNLAWYRLVIDYRQQRQEDLLRALGFKSIEWSQVLVILGGACALVMLAYIIWSRRVPPLDPSQRLYRRFCRKLARTGVVRAPHEGALDFARRAAAARPDLAIAINAVTVRFLDLRYGNRPSNDDLRELARLVGALRPRRFNSP